MSEQSIPIDATLQNFIYKHTQDLENVQRNKKKGKGKFIGHQVNSNQTKESKNKSI
jgi:hypothetical protein